MLVNNGFGIRERLRIKEPNKGIDALGVLLAPDSSIKDKYNHFHKNACSWAQDLLQR